VNEVLNRSRRVCVVGCLALLFASVAWSKDKDKPAAGKDVDSGSFGVFTSGHRVATEVFSIKQGGEGSVVSSEFKSEQGEQKAEQSSSLELTPSVELRRYEWKEISPEKTQATVSPSDTFLIERFGEGGGDKEHEQNFLLPASTSILDDYFFVHREVLAWKYLATACKQDKDKGGLGCPLGQKVQLGTLNPHARSSMAVTIEFTGKDKVSIRGAERELSRFVLRSETGDWAFWLDDQFKLIRLLSEGGTEVVRD
jgi:hypothetical protein